MGSKRVISEATVRKGFGGGHNRGQHFPREVLDPDEVARLMDAMGGGPRGDRNRALVAVLYRAGLRLSEAIGAEGEKDPDDASVWIRYPKPGLRVQDIDLRAGTLNVVEGKAGDQRIVGLDDGALLYLERWINRRQKLGLPPKGKVFVQFDGSGMNDSSVRQLFARAGKRAGLHKRVHPHGVRHSHAALMAWSVTPVHVIQRQLGHKTLDTTARYIGQVAPRQLVEAVNQIQWEPES
jgi:site-specific recombinase XerC